MSIFRRFVVQSRADRASAAIAEIRRIIAEATQDLPAGEDKGEPIPFAFQAHLLNLFRRDLGMPFEETRGIPLKQLAQHFREVLHHASKGKALLITPAEAAIWCEHLSRIEKQAGASA